MLTKVKPVLILVLAPVGSGIISVTATVSEPGNHNFRKFSSQTDLDSGYLKNFNSRLES